MHCSIAPYGPMRHTIMCCGSEPQAGEDERNKNKHGRLPQISDQSNNAVKCIVVQLIQDMMMR